MLAYNRIFEHILAWDVILVARVEVGISVTSKGTGLSATTQAVEKDPPASERFSILLASHSFVSMIKNAHSLDQSQNENIKYS